MTSEYMNNLYRDLLSNSPQTVTIPIPSDMGTGQIAQVVTKQGAVVSDWKMNYFSDMNVRGINSEDYIQMLFCLNDGVSWNIAGSREGACLAKGESCIYRFFNALVPFSGSRGVTCRKHILWRRRFNFQGTQGDSPLNR